MVSLSRIWNVRFLIYGKSSPYDSSIFRICSTLYFTYFSLVKEGLMVKKQILFGMLAAGAVVAALTGCDTQDHASTLSSPAFSSSVASQTSGKEPPSSKLQNI